MDFNHGRKQINKSLGDTRYFNDTKIYTNNNQYRVTVYKDNLAYIDSASDAVGILYDTWAIKDIINRTSTIAGYYNHPIIQEKSG